jgi:hypothetical protein
MIRIDVLSWRVCLDFDKFEDIFRAGHCLRLTRLLRIITAGLALPLFTTEKARSPFRVITQPALNTEFLTPPTEFMCLAALHPT